MRFERRAPTIKGTELLAPLSVQIVIKILICSLIAVTTSCQCRADEFGISQQTFEADGLRTVFLFRNGKLIHEITVFANVEAGRHPNWVERFYVGDQPVFIRAGGAGLVSEHYTGLSRASVLQGKRGDAAPPRLTVGQESYDLGADGFYHLIADQQSVLRESVLVGAEFSSRVLETEREKCLHQPHPQE